jgi:hypothetical protein
MSFDDWSQDVQLLAEWLNNRAPKIPLVLHGLEVGALLAARAFHAGVGDVLLLWSPPTTANEALRSVLLRRVALEQILRYDDYRKPTSAFIQEMEQGASIEVAGYEWSGRLWRDSFGFDLPAAMVDERSARLAYEKPVRIVSLTKAAAPLVKGGFVVDDKAKDFTWLFDDNWSWLAASLGCAQGGSSEPGD